MKNKVMKISGILVIVILLLVILSPKILKSMGLHPDFEGSQQYDLQGKRALVVTTATGCSINRAKLPANQQEFLVLK